MDIKGKHGKPSLPERLACNYSEKKATLFAREFRVKMRYLHVFIIDNCSDFEDYLKIHKKEDQRANNLSLVRKSTWVTKMFFNLSFLKIQLQFGSQYDYSKLPGEYFAITILLVIFGIVMQSFAIAYERFHMDPMKRGLVNQLSTTYMAFSMCYSITRIIRYFIEWLAPKPLHHFIFNSFRIRLSLSLLFLTICFSCFLVTEAEVVEDGTNAIKASLPSNHGIAKIGEHLLVEAITTLLRGMAEEKWRAGGGRSPLGEAIRRPPWCARAHPACRGGGAHGGHGVSDDHL